MAAYLAASRFRWHVVRMEEGMAEPGFGYIAGDGERYPVPLAEAAGVRFEAS
jgi:hypothetical protein